MHPYEMRSMMLGRGHDRAVRLKESSLYDTVARLANLGFIEMVEVSREGRRPERTVYAITQSGRDELLIWLRDLVSVPSPEYPNFAAALMFVYALGKDGAIAALIKRAAILEAEISRVNTYQQALLADIPEIYLANLPAGETDFPRMFVIEEEYAQAMRLAELSWVRQIASELRDGTLPWPVVGEPEDASPG
jgi:DNA-binding PadR family transcriptional regulator